MLQLRLSLPTHLADTVESEFSTNPSVASFNRSRGASQRPAGDVITILVVPEAADTVITRLSELGVAEEGVLSVSEPRLVLAKSAVQAEAVTPGSAADAVIWEEVSRRTSEDASMSATYLLLMVCAMLIAGIGVLSDSPILIVGAMVVGPDFGPTAATAVGIATRRWAVARAAFATLIIGFVVGIAATIVLTIILRSTQIFDAATVLAPRPQTAFIYQVGWPSVFVAAIAGVVGMLSLTTAKSGALVGVFISVTTIPAAANVAVAIVYGMGNEAWGSLGQLAVNIVTIQVAAGLTLLIQRAISRRQAEHVLGLTDHTS